MNNTDSITLVEKTNSAIPFNLYADDLPIDLTSAVQIVFTMVDKKSKVYRFSSLDSGSVVVVTSNTLGAVAFTPPYETVFTYDRSPYFARCWVYPNSSQKYSVPRDSHATIEVLREY
jgi:hypothetical protein